MKKYRITFCIVNLLSLNEVNAQMSIPNDNEKKCIIEKVFEAGYASEKCDHTDSVCYWENDFRKKAFLKLKEKNISMFKMFSPILKKEIKSYEFADSFNNYFKIDSMKYNVFFFGSKGSRNATFGVTTINKKLDSISFSPIEYENNNNEVFINYSEKEKSTSIFQMSFENKLFVKDNRIYVIVDNDIVEGSVFFKRYSLEIINKKFRGVVGKLPH